MESEQWPRKINGINLDDYYPNHRSYNSVVYDHKKFLEPPQKEKKVEKEKKEKDPKEKKAKKKAKTSKCDKCQQAQDVTVPEFMNSGMFGQAVQFGKTIVPVVIPPSGIVSPVYYTIKASKKSNKKPKVDISTHTHDITYKKERSKRIVETYRNEKSSQKESISVKETVSYSSQNDTLDELHINPSLCCTFSDVSDHKQPKKEKRDKPKQDRKLPLVPSESFEALATEFLNSHGDTRIKIHLMNESEKNLIAENIRQPLLNAIKECVLELNSQSRNTEVTTVQKFVKCNTQKLDHVLNKLSCIEHKLDQCLVKENTKVQADSFEVQIAKASTLEHLGEDLLEVKEESSSDEYYQRPSLSARKKARGVSTIVQLEAVGKGEKGEGLGGGEVVSEGVNPGAGQLVRPDRPNRIPARFCWTDAARKNTG